MRDLLGRMAVDPAGAANDMLQELTSLRDKIDANLPTEQAMGMFDVTQGEAQQVIDFTKALNSHEA